LVFQLLESLRATAPLGTILFVPCTF